MLAALEQGDYHRLPGDFFARAFLRTYARELHVPEAEVLDAYAADLPAPVAPTSLPKQRRHDETIHSATRRSRAGWLIAAATTVAVVVFGVTRTPPAPLPEPGVVGTSGRVAAEPAAAAAVDPPATAPAGPLSIEIRPIRPVWVTGYADDERVLYRRVEPGERINLTAKERLTFRVGDAGAFEFSLDGAPARAPGRDGEVREFTISRANRRDFIR